MRDDDEAGGGGHAVGAQGGYAANGMGELAAPSAPARYLPMPAAESYRAHHAMGAEGAPAPPPAPPHANTSRNPDPNPQPKPKPKPKPNPTPKPNPNQARPTARCRARWHAPRALPGSPRRPCSKGRTG